MNGLSWSRFKAILIKEFIQMGRDRLTFAMMMGIPIMQLILFGFALNNDPKHLPTAVVSTEDTQFTRSLVAGLTSSDYFRIIGRVRTEAEAEHLVAAGQAAFIVNIPPGFSRDLVRGDRPQLLIEADASDPSLGNNALAALPEIVRRALRHDIKGSMGALAVDEGPVDLVMQRRYNPEGFTRYNIVPGLLGVVLTMTMSMMTALSLTREAERGTMENLLSMPVTPLEVMLGKILPSVAVGSIQVFIILAAARFVFGVPTVGSLWLLFLALIVFITSMLALGYTFSTLAKTQMQAMQMTFFFFLPSLLLSGFLFPFLGMPRWAQVLGEIIPLTHMLRIARGIILKGNGMAEIWPDLLANLAFLIVIATIALSRYRRTLD